jgi:hypothetical protein
MNESGCRGFRVLDLCSRVRQSIDEEQASVVEGVEREEKELRELEGGFCVCGASACAFDGDVRTAKTYQRRANSTVMARTAQKLQGKAVGG